jgi:hypothetical protein
MATWKKVLVSGSSAAVTTLTADSLVVGSNQSILTAGVVLTGSFTGSFKGDGSGLTGVVSTNPNALTAGSGLSSGGTYDGSVARTFSVDSGSILPFISSSVFSTVSGDITITSGGVAAIASGVIVNADVNATAAIAFSKLASLTSANILVGSVTNVPTSVPVTGDVLISNTGITSIASGVIVNADVNTSAAIAFSKLASLTSANILVGSVTNVPTSTAVTGDVTIDFAGITTIGAAKVTNAKLFNSGSIFGSTAVALGSTVTTLDGLISVTSTGFTGSLSGNASTATSASFATTASFATLAATATSATSSSFATTASIALQVSTSISSQNLEHNVLFVDTSGPGLIQVDGGLRYNPNQNLLTTTSSYAILAETASFVTSASFATLAATATSASFATTASFATLAATATSAATLTTPRNINGVSFNGSADITVTAAADTLTGGTLNASVTGSSLTSVGTLTTLTAGNVTITGNLSVAGTASFTNTDNLNIKDKFILLNSGSATLADSGWVTQYNAAGSGSAFYLDADSTGTYGRFAVAYDAIGTSTSLTQDEFVTTTKVTANAPSADPTWGGTTNGQGNIHVNSTTGDIYIYS